MNPPRLPCAPDGVDTAGAAGGAAVGSKAVVEPEKKRVFPAPDSDPVSESVHAKRRSPPSN